MEKIKLNFINRSNNSNNINVVIFQKNGPDVEYEYKDPQGHGMITKFGPAPFAAYAWRVIKGIAPLEHHPFTYSSGIQVSARDSNGNFTPLFDTNYGSVFEMTAGATGDVFSQKTIPARNPSSVEIRNNLEKGAINAYCYRDGLLLDAFNDIVPGQLTVFDFQKPRIYLAVLSNIEQGQFISEEIFIPIDSHINLLVGISSADIVLTGGGPAEESKPYTFSLENIKY